MRTASAFARYRAGSTPRNGASASEINRREPKPVDTSKNSKNHPERRPAAASCLAVQCDQISTLNENLLGSYSEHSCAYWHPNGSAKLSAKEKTGVSHERQHPPGPSKKVRTALGRQISSTGCYR